MCYVFHYFLYVLHLIKFVCLFFYSFLLLPDFLVNKDIHNLKSERLAMLTCRVGLPMAKAPRGVG